MLKVGDAARLSRAARGYGRAARGRLVARRFPSSDAVATTPRFGSRKSRKDADNPLTLSEQAGFAWVEIQREAAGVTIRLWTLRVQESSGNRPEVTPKRMSWASNA